MFFNGEMCNIFHKDILIPLILSVITYCEVVVKMFRQIFKICSKALSVTWINAKNVRWKKQSDSNNNLTKYARGQEERWSFQKTFKALHLIKL